MQSWLGVPTASLDSGIDVDQEINVGPGNLVQKNKHRATKVCSF